MPDDNGPDLSFFLYAEEDPEGKIPWDAPVEQELPDSKDLEHAPEGILDGLRYRISSLFAMPSFPYTRGVVEGVVGTEETSSRGA